MAGEFPGLQLLRSNLSGAEIEGHGTVGAADGWLTPGRFALMLGLLVVAAFPGVLLGGTRFITRDFGLFG